jgi:hypothetical protein
MKPEPPPKVPGKTPWQRLDNAVRTIFSVPREAVLKEEAKLKKLRQKKRAKKKAIA